MDGVTTSEGMVIAATALDAGGGGGHVNYGAPQSNPQVGRGLGLLQALDMVRVQQQMSLVEAISSWEDSNKYKVMNSANAQIYFAYEDSSACCRQCCGADRGFELKIAEPSGQEAIRVVRDFKLCANIFDCCAMCGCCQHSIRVESPPGTYIGSVFQNCTCLTPRYTITDANDEEVFTVSGPCFCLRSCCACCLFCDLKFEIFSVQTGDEIGSIKKKFSGLKEMVSDADNFEVSFPVDLDVRMKAVLIGTCFFIDFRHFEKSSGAKNKEKNLHD